MRHPLEVKLRRYRARARLYSTLTASGYLLAVYAIVLLTLGTIDWYLRPTTPGIRVSLWLLALTPLTYVPISLYQAVRRRRSNVELAANLEHVLPPLRNWLAGAIDFLQIKKEAPTVGSKELRDEVIGRATDLSTGLDFSRTLNRRPVYRSLGTMTFVLGIVTIIVALHPNAARTASHRLAWPLAPIAWPQKTSLVVKKSTTRLAQGNSFQAIVADKHGRSLPEEATVFYRFYQDTPTSNKTASNEKGKPVKKKATPTIETETIRTDTHQIVLFRDRVNRSFSFRVTSGDDSRMPWQAVTAVEPPTVESLKMEVTPPAYVGDNDPVTILVRDRTCLREGSKVRFIAKVSKPVRQATLLLGEMEYEGQITEKGLQILFPADIENPVTQKTATQKTSITIDHSCSIALRLEDRLGLEVTVDRSQQIEFIENRPPTLTLLRPESAQRVVAGTVLPIEASVEDDLGVRSVVMHWTIEGVSRAGASATRSSSVPIYQGPEKFPKSPQDVGACPAAKPKLTASYRWDLTPMKLSVDDRISLHVVATDYSGISNACEPIEITVVDPASFINRLVSDQRAITDEMAQALTVSKRNHRRMIQVQQQLKQNGEVRPANVDLLRALTLDRRQTVRTLTDENDGLIARSTSILTQLDNSRLRARSLRSRLVQLVADLETLRSEVLPAIEQSTTSATKNAELTLDPQSEIHVEVSEILSPLSTAILEQERLITKLQAMLGQLDEMVDYQRFCDDLKRLLQSQHTLTDETKTLGRSTLGKITTDLKPAELTQLDKTSRSQAHLARESGQTVARMVQAAQRLSTQENNRIASAVKSSEARSIGATLTRASEAISQNQLGRAVKLQAASLATLEAMLTQMTQTAGPLSGEETTSAQQIQLEGHQPGDTAEQGEKPDDLAQQDTAGQPDNQTSEATSFSQNQPRQLETHLKPKTINNLIERFWGELPNREREPIIQLPAERFLPGYEPQIEAYYRRLLEQ